MRRFLLAAGVACAVLLNGPVDAQFNTTMPGQVIGSYQGNVVPVGQRLPSAAPQAGQSITANAMQRPYDPNHPYDVFKGTNIDPQNVVAPLVADGRQYAPPDALDRLSERIKSFFVSNPPPPRPPYAPGITRRTRERIQHMWRRD
ncbi:MAG: hypothetical protein J0I06_00640 [Planctomycetes bacterium]|nr:hypothetical protein [Planctomycetota bacterium]